MEAKEDQLRDWSSLLPEILNLIAKNLSEISDFVRFRAVCKAWRFSTPITDQPPQFPWIVYRHGELEPLFRCYSITSNKTYTMDAPKIFCMAFGNISNGYIIAQHSLEIENPLSNQFFLFNPLNNHEIRLPAFDYDKICRYGLWKCQMGEYVFCRQRDKLSFWHLGQNSWHKLNLGSSVTNFMMLCYKNMIFFLEELTGVIKAIDMFTGTIVYDIPTTEDYSIGDALYMVEDSGDILIVTQRYSDSERFDVYQLEANKSGSPCWVKVTSIGDRALFIGCSCSALIVRANNFARIKSNSIYFFCNYNNDKCEIKRMDIDTSAVEHLQDFFRRLPVWFVPNLRYHL